MLIIRGVRKAFAGIHALAGVDLEIRAGEVHALLGENGAGKSTLMRILAGVERADAGTIEDPQRVRPHGLAMIHQELALAPHLTVLQNFWLGRERTTRGWLALGAMRARVREVLAELGHAEIDPSVRVQQLAPAARQIVEIARAIAFDARVVVMDEPTSSLGPTERARLFTAARQIAARGTAVVFISHSFEEVRQVATRFTVLRDGVTVGTGLLAEVTDAQLVELMAGRKLGVRAARQASSTGAPFVVVDRVAGERLPRDASLVLCRGEVLGLFGMCGAGRTELLRALFGLEPVRRGTITIGGVPDHGRDPHARIAQHAGLVSEDRRGEGLAQARTITENLTLSGLARYSKRGWLARARRDAAATSWLQRLSIKARSGDQLVRELSGGNQQKVAFARLMHDECDVWLLDEPTRGIDVFGKQEIERLIAEAKARGTAILLVSSYIPELLLLADTIAVMKQGVLGAKRPVAEWSEATLLVAAAGGGAA